VCLRKHQNRWARNRSVFYEWITVIHGLPSRTILEHVKPGQSIVNLWKDISLADAHDLSKGNLKILYLELVDAVGTHSGTRVSVEILAHRHL